METLLHNPITEWIVPEKHRGNLTYIAPFVRSKVIEKATSEAESYNGRIPKWFLPRHPHVVENRAQWLQEHSPVAAQVDPDLVNLTVWTHDYGRIIGHDQHHHVVSALAVFPLLVANGVDEDTAGMVARANLRHRAKSEHFPVTGLESVIASADALSHFDGAHFANVDGFIGHNGFWVQLWRQRLVEGRTVQEIMDASAKKMQRDANQELVPKKNGNGFQGIWKKYL